MKLTVEQSYELLERFGCYVTHVCDKCSRLLGPASYTRKGETGVWCSRDCRDGASAREPKTCKHCRAKLPEGKRRGTTFCDDACRKAFRRQNGSVHTPATPKLSRTKPSIYRAFSIEKRQDGISGHPPVVGGLQD